MEIQEITLEDITKVMAPFRGKTTQREIILQRIESELKIHGYGSMGLFDLLEGQGYLQADMSDICMPVGYIVRK